MGKPTGLEHKVRHCVHCRRYLPFSEFPRKPPGLFCWDCLRLMKEIDLKKRKALKRGERTNMRVKRKRTPRPKPTDGPWDVKMNERQLTQLIMDYLKWVPNSTWKKIRGSMGMKGIPDIIGCWEGKYVELEVKTERGRLTPEQAARIEEIRAAGGIAEIVRSLEEVHKLFGENSRITIKTMEGYIHDSK